MRHRFLGLAQRVQDTFEAFNARIAEQAKEIKRLQAKLAERPAGVGWGPVVRTIDDLPPIETEVLILVRGRWRIGALQWETPGFEDTFKAFKYWDDPEDDGQDWEWYDVTHWCSLPALPEPYEFPPEKEDVMELGGFEVFKS
jgi:hypothetical protein